MRNIKKVLSVLLAVCIAFSMMSVGIFANAASDDFMKIIYVDGGRKYFTKDWFVALINEAAADGYTHVEIGVGNDGLRFLLDDMSLEVNGTAYSSEDVAAGINAGNIAYYDAGEANELTEAEMDAIYAAADKAGIEIIPLINTPGHMDAIVDCMEYVGIADAAYDGSARTVDVTNTEAVAFTKALLEKYVAYFASKGSEIFDMGADEYANDIYSGYSGMGFGKLMDSDQYDDFVTYVNDVAAIIKNAGMTPMAFNDGIYYDEDTSYGTFDSDIIISYWSSGWNGYNVASATYLANMGHKMINTHGDYYYILGVNDTYTPDSTTSHTDANAYTQTSGYSNTAFMGSTISDPTGSRLCVWSDYPGAETETEVAANLRLIMRAMALRMDDQSIDGMDTETVVEGGFNADGTINVPADVTVSDEATGISVSAPGLTEVEVEEVEDAVISVATDVVTYEITPKKAINDSVLGKYTGAGEVSIPVPADWANAKYIYGAVKNANGSMTLGIQGVYENGVFTFTSPHFSEISAYASDYANNPINIVANGTKTVTLDGHVGTDGETGTTADGVASYSVKHITTEIPGATYYVRGDEVSSVTSGTYVIGYSDYMLSNSSSSLASEALIASGATISDEAWTVTVNGSTYTISKQIGDTVYYLGMNRTSSWGSTSYSLTLTTSQTSWTYDEGYLYQTYTSQGGWGGSSTTYCYIDYDNGWTMSYSTTKNTAKNSAVALDFYGLEERNEAATSKETTEITFTGINEGETSVVIGDTNYVINVIAEDLSDVDPLKIEYWITNAYVTVEMNGTEVNDYEISAAEAYGESGVAVTAFAPTYGYKTVDGPDKATIYWHSRVLEAGAQTDDGGNDQTANGTALEYIRYYGGAWSYSADRVTWTPFDMSDYQFIAYYLMYTDFTEEVVTAAKDWGFDSGEGWGYSDQSAKTVLSFQIVDESGSVFPATADLDDNSWIFNYWEDRYIGYISLLTDYADSYVYKVTYTMGESSTSYNSSNYSHTITALSYDLDNETVMIENEEGLGSVINLDCSSADADYPIKWTSTQDACLIRIYIKSKPSEDNLTVNYFAQGSDTPFHNYAVTVNEGTLFDTTLTEADIVEDADGNYVTTVENYKGNTVYVYTSLYKMPTIPAEYRYVEAQVVDITVTEDGKVINIYYAFEAAHKFVVDFGLPLEITRSDLGITDTTGTLSATNGAYGTVEVVNGVVVYTPNKVFGGKDSISVTIESEGEDPVTSFVDIYPATTVYYDAEEKFFASADDSWTFGGTAVTDAQATEKLGESGIYGYDAAYNDKYETAQAVAPAASASATFTFTGTGVDFYVNSKQASGAMTIIIKRVNDDGTIGSIAKLITVQTKAVDGYSDYTDGQAVDPYGMCAASVDGLEHGKYIAYINTVTSMGAYKAVYIDGFRVHNTIEDTDGSVYGADGEANAFMAELRDQVLAGLNTTASISEKYSEQIAEVLHSQVYDTAASAAGPVVISAHEAGESNYVLQDLIDNGPKNELFLQPGEAVTFSLKEGVKVQLGLRAPTGAVSISVNDDTVDVKSSADMFYLELEGEVVITNPSDSQKLLSVTELKVLGAQEGDQIFEDITAQNLSVALMSLGYETEENAENDVTEDINGDGTVDVKDMIRLKKYIAEEDVEVSFPERAASYVEENAASELSDVRKAVLFN